MRYRPHYRHTVATWFTVMLCLLMGQAFGSLTFSAYGPQLYVRAKGAPMTQTGNFYVKNPNTQYTLYVVNGAGSHAPVDSAVVSLNGSVILSEQDFNGHPHAISRAVTMRAGYNSVAVQLRSDPGGAISVQIQGVDPDPPSITATVSPLPNSAGWNNTPVTISFSCSDAYFNVTCPAPINVDTQGQNQVFSGTAVDSVGLSATASVSVNVDLTPPNISASVSPLPNSAGWTRNSAVVTFSCGDSLSGVAQCPAPVTVSAQGTSQVNGTAYDNAGNSSQTSLSVSVDTFPPVLSIASPANGSVVTSSALTVSGSVSDASSGVASVLCNNAAASFGGGAFSCNLNLNPGSNTVQVLATDAAGNTTLVNLGVTYNLASPPPPPPPSVLNPPPTQIQITPTTITMAVGERRSVSATDNLGRSIPVSWAVDDSSVLHLNSDGSMVALQAGTATVTASYQQLTAQTTVTVNAAGPLALGTERWDLQPLDVVNNWINSFVGAQPVTPGAPDLYVLESTPTGTLARALAGDGHQLWSTPLLSSSVSSNSSFLWDSEGPQAGTPDGGLVALDSQTFSNNGVDFSQYSLMKVDAASHAVAWTYNSPAMLASVLAVHPNGDVYAVQTSNSSTTASAAVLALNGASGQVKFSAPMPLSVQTYQNTGYDANGNLVCQQGNTVVVQSLPSHGPLAVLPDGNVYMEVETTNTTLLGCQATGFTMTSYADALELLKVQPSGTSSAVMLEQFSDTNTQTHGQPGQVLPDGEGGILAGWNRSVTVGSKNQAFVSHLLNGTQADYALPWTSTYPINFVMALGEGGTAYAQQGAFSGVILTLDVNSGTANPATTTNEQFVSALAGGGAILADNSQILSVDANGGTAVLSNALGMYGLSHYVGGTWLGYNYNDSSLEAAVGPAMDAGITSWPMLAGNLAQQQAPPVPQLRHFLPVQPGSQYSISQVESALQGAAANNLFYALDQASVASFLEQLDKPNDAVAFLGNALGYSFSGGAQSIGLCFASDCLEKAASASDPSYPLLTPSGLSNGFVDASLLAGRTRVVFVASADDGAIFQELWGIDATTAHQALVLPPNSSVSLQQAAQVWVAIAQNLVAGQTVQNAVANANAQLGTAWTVVGDGSVRIKAVQ